jgi:hypothetical protein
LPMTNAQKAKLLDHYYGGPDLARPATLYIGLSTTTPTDTGANFTEPVGNDYARVAVVNNDTTWVTATVANPSVKKNGAPIEFPEATGNWGTITHWGIFEAATGGTCVEWAACQIAKAINTGDIARFKSGDLIIELEGVA